MKKTPDFYQALVSFPYYIKPCLNGDQLLNSLVKNGGSRLLIHQKKLITDGMERL